MDDDIPIKSITTIVLVLCVIVALGMWGCPKYKVYQLELKGKAALKESEWNRQIKVEEAKALKASAQLKAEAEVIRAHGVDSANKIIQKGLGGPEGYLRYLWIQNLEEMNEGNVIYIPTEAGIPILEAGKR